MNSVLLSKKVRGSAMEADEMYVIYGAPGSGKTTLASTFPKTKDKPMLYIDVLEGGSKVIDKKDLDNTDVIQVTNYEEFDNIMSELFEGQAQDADGKAVELKYSTIVLDTVTNIEYIMKQFVMKESRKDSMTLQLWGKAKDKNDFLFNLLRKLHQKTGSIIVAVAHDKAIDNEENPTFNKVIPSLMTSAAVSLCAKVSYVWYTKAETVNESDDDGNVTSKIVFNTYIDTYPYLMTKCRKPKAFKLPKVKVTDLTYESFKECTG